MNGKKTYIVAAVAIACACLNAFAGTITWPQALDLIVPAVLAVTIRHGISTEAAK